jgi:uncharacterized protein (TIGR00661 family)
MTKCKIYLSDEGFGPIVRQRAIINELKKLDNQLDITLQTQQHLAHARYLIHGVKFTDKFNNILWCRYPDGSPDIKKIKSYFRDYTFRSESFIAEEENILDADLVISDFVFEAFETAWRKKIPSFGVAHFTWDWFFSKLYPIPLKTKLLNRFSHQVKKAKYLFFPPFTPQEILNHYGKKVIQVPLIVNSHNCQGLPIGQEKKFKILLIDSGSGVMDIQFRHVLEKIVHIKDIQFFISEKYHVNAENVTVIDENSLFIDYIPYVDLVISRAGFNTISECIASRTPMLLLSEPMNPEMAENILNIKFSGLGSFISEKEFLENLDTFLPEFIEHEYQTLQSNLKNHDIKSNGAAVIAEKIMNNI